MSLERSNKALRISYDSLEKESDILRNQIGSQALRIQELVEKLAETSVRLDRANELTRFRDLRLTLASGNIKDLEAKIAQLMKDRDTTQLLMNIGAAVRKRFMVQEASIKGSEQFELLLTQAGNIAAHSEDEEGDCAVFSKGYWSEEDGREYFRRIYEADAGTHQIGVPDYPKFLRMSKKLSKIRGCDSRPDLYHEALSLRPLLKAPRDKPSRIVDIELFTTNIQRFEILVEVLEEIGHGPGTIGGGKKKQRRSVTYKALKCYCFEYLLTMFKIREKRSRCWDDPEHRS